MRELRNQKTNPWVSFIIIAFIGIIFITGTVVRVVKKDFYSLLTFFPLCLAVFLILVFISQKTAGIERKRRRAVKTGKCFEGKVINVEYDKNIQCKPLSGETIWNPLIVTVMYTDESGFEHTEKSESLYYNLSDDVKRFSSKIWISDCDKDIYVQIFYHE